MPSSSMPWIKLYVETLNDPKMGRLGDRLWRRAVEMFMLAGETGAGGFLPPIEDIAWTLRISADDLTADLMELEKVNIVKHMEEGWFVVHFADRQDADSNAERQRRYRERKHHDRYTGNETTPDDSVTPDSNESVTKRDEQSNEGSNETELRLREEEEEEKINNLSPDGEGGAIAISKNGGKPKSDYVLAMERLENTFAKARGSPLPDWSSPKAAKSSNKRWRMPLSEIFRLCNQDIGRAERLVILSVQHMIASRLTFDAPDQILKVAGSLRADLESGKLTAPGLPLTEDEKVRQFLASFKPLEGTT